MNRPTRWRRLAVLAVAALVTTEVGSQSVVATPLAGSQGTDTSLPLTESAVTVHGRGVFADLAVTVNQTTNLTNQVVSITWAGGTPTRSGPSRFAANYLQIMQCWGEDDGSVAGSPGPAPERCVQGASDGVYGGALGGLFPSGSFATSRVIARSNWDLFDARVGYTDARTRYVWRSFASVTGSQVDVHVDPTFNPSVVGGNYWRNDLFGIQTTNEIPGAMTAPNGTGAELFQVLTGVQSTGLGCGQQVITHTDGTKSTPKCWIVIVPRGEPTVENLGTPFADRADQYGVMTSPLSTAAWQNRIAIPIEFNPVDSPCDLAAQARRISGTELMVPAVSSWQPVLCGDGTLPPYSYASVGDATARQQMTIGASGAPGMVVTGAAISPDLIDPAQPVVYAPLAVSGLVIGFNVERNPRPDAAAEAQALAGIRVADINLTPRLVAKLLTQSYQQQLTIIRPPEYEWLATNPANLGLDPDFIRFNPEFAELQIASGRNFGGFTMPNTTSDAARVLWEWVLADPEAATWLAGTPDEWGMRVNTAYSTDAATNRNGVAFADPVPSSFPKSDPYCYQAPARGDNGVVKPSPLCGTDWLPYARSFADAAQIARAASDSARIVENQFAAASSEAWNKELPQCLGRRSILAITDSASAAQFGLQTARLSRAGDNGDTRTFIAATTDGLLRGLEAMTADAATGVAVPDPRAAVAGAYPLTMVSYAAVRPLGLDTDARSDYAAFVEYATTAGQVSGPELGELPSGYAPLTEALRTQAAAAATAIRTLQPAPPPDTSTSAPETSTTLAPATTTAPVPVQPPASSGSSGSWRPPSGPVDATPPATLAEPAATEETAPPESTEPTVAETAPPTTTTVVARDPVATARTPRSRVRFVLPGAGLVALTSVLGVMEISKRPRRGAAGSGLWDDEADDDPLDDGADIDDRDPSAPGSER